MLRFILYRLALIIPTFIGVTLIAFFFIRILPGDPVQVLAGERGVSPERHAQVLAQLGFDKPLYEQYFTYLGNVLRGDFGTSFASKRPVAYEFFSRFPATVELSLCAIILATVLGIPAGIFAAIKRGSWFDQVTMTSWPSAPKRSRPRTRFRQAALRAVFHLSGQRSARRFRRLLRQ